MISRLPKWVIISGSALALTGGFVNAMGFLSIYHEALTHLTGTTTSLAIAVAQHKTEAIGHLAAIIASFVTGAALSAFITRDAVLRLGRRYGAVMILEGLFLFASAYFLSRGQRIGESFAAFACGLQNGMASTFSGAVVRTTHVSGILTDIGIMLGHWLRRLPVDARRVKLYTALYGAFFLGGMIGTFFFAKWGMMALCYPAAFVLLSGIWYSSYVYWQKTHPVEN